LLSAPEVIGLEGEGNEGKEAEAAANLEVEANPRNLDA
jgi:hypothetical protein